MPTDLQVRILNATLKSLTARDAFSDKNTALLTAGLKKAENDIAKAILHYKSLGSLPDNKLAALKGLEKLQNEIVQITKRLKQEQTLLFKKSSRDAFKLGIGRGIEDLTNAAMPFYRNLTPGGIDKLATKVFTIVDTDALDFMTQYNVTLAGDIHRELADGIKRTVLTGVTTGKSAEEIVRDMGKVIIDKNSFRQAGSRVFSKAQYRMEMIARTEIIRAHNMGRLKFHQRVGVQKLEWLATDDERMCAICGALDGKTYPIDKFPQQPAHPHCRCTNVVAWPMSICGATMAAKAAAEEQLGDSCILPPHTIESLADAQAQENAKLKKAFEGGDIGDLNGLTVKQLQTLSKQNGVAVARTKADFIKLLDAAEPGIHHGDLAGAALSAKLKQYNIGLLRSKEELVALLGEKQAQFKAAKAQAAQLAKVPAPSDLGGMTVNQLKELAKDNGISLNMTKEETIAMLDVLEPGIDHSNLKGKELGEFKAKHGIGILKNKEQLVSALQKKAGADMAEAAKKKALDEAKQAIAIKQKANLDATFAKVVVPASPSDYQSFLAAVNEAESAITAGTHLPQDILAGQAKELALKKQLFQQQFATLKTTDLKTIAKQTQLKHWQWANKEELVTLFSETDPAKIDAAKQSIEKKHAAWAQKHGGVKPKSPETPDAEPPKKATTKPLTETPQPAKKGSEFETIDVAWDDKVKSSAFKNAGKANVGGAHEKEFWTDDNGDAWLFKPQKGSDDFVAHGEEAVYKIARLIDPHAIEVRSIQLGGKTGSIQKWRTDLKKDFDFRNIDPESLTTVELEQIQREHVIDWLIANHDGHSKQFLRAQDGTIYGIDKGQAFKHLGSDKLSIDYHPNGVYGEEEPYYNRIFRTVKQGKLRVDPAVSLRYIQQVEKIADDDYLGILKPYAEGRFGKDKASLQKFYDQALERKHGLRGDFEKYYRDILGDRNFRFGNATAQVKAGLLGDNERSIVEDARKLGWQGKTLPFDGDDIEDQNALIFSETVKDKRRTVIKMKVRPEANGKMLDAIRQGEDVSGPRKGQPLDEDKFYGDILTAIKHVSYHAGDGNYNDTKISAALKHSGALEKLARSNETQVKEMAQGYLKWLDELKAARDGKRSINGVFDQYRPEILPSQKKATLPFKARQEDVLSTLRQIKNGEIVVENDAATNAKLFRSKSIGQGKQYTVVWDDGTRVRYRPWDNDNLFAQRGELEMSLDGDVSPERIESMLAKLSSIGIDTKVASAENAEYMYLQKLAYIRKTDKSADYKKVVKTLDERDATLSERVTALRGYWERELKVKDITRLPGYNPQGEYQAGFLDRTIKGGYRQQYRFDVTDEDLEREMKGYALSHRLTNGENLSGFLNTILDQNGAMVSTVEKMRMGVPPGGMSPQQDMRTGGATYFFTRIAKMPSSNPDVGLYFKKSMLRRMDAISYSHDAYGRVTDDYVRDHRGTTISEWKQFSQKSGNETIFKYSVTLLDNIDHVVVNNDNERREIIGSFTRRGINKLPDGRKVEDVVVTSNDWGKRK